MLGCALALPFDGALAAPAPGAPLSLSEALQIASQRSAAVAATRAQAQAERQLAVAAGQRPDPVLKFGVNNLPINGPDRYSLTSDFMTMRSVAVMQEFTRSDKLRARSERAEREAQAADAEGQVMLAEVQRAAAAAWLDRYYQTQLRDLLQRARAEAELQVQAAEAAYRGARGPQADVFAARGAVAQIDDRIAEAERQIAVAQTRLTRWVGERAADPPGAPPPLDTPPAPNTAMNGTMRDHPQIELLRRQEQTAEADADMARADRHSDVSVELMYSQRGPAYSNMVSLNFSMPLQWDQRDRQDRELAARLARVDRARAQREDAERMLTAEVSAMQQEWQSNHARLARYDATLIPLAEQRTAAARTAYAGGTASLGSVLDARRSEIDLRIERLRLAMDTARLWAQLHYQMPATATQTERKQP
ncbi:MAG: TolC family protein [Betaproteobacteria bacterium]|nr:TolC family protein [Betaproteobacteria bacterium]